MTLSFEQMLAISDSFDQEDDEIMSFTCLSCGFSEDVPKWVIDEQADMDFFAGPLETLISLLLLWRGYTN